ncbi:MAG: M20 family metallopeptidase [Lentisphaeria bacterium]|nr:M20 family metallopeptidase [Lentisphaeria bacterium]
MDHLEKLNAHIGSIKKELRKISDAIWNKPELAYKEFFASSEAVKFLKEQNFTAESNYCGLETAFKAEYGEGKPVFAIFAEFDALPDVGHGCGHNLICVSALAAFCAAAKIMQENDLKGKIVLLGSPAEESGGGKVIMISEGCLEGVDAAMMLHPSFRTVPDTGSTAITRFDVVFHGKAAHAAGSTELGINALAAVNLLFAGVNAYRETVPETARMHGIVTDGGEAPNIIPSRAACRFFLRSTDQKWIGKIEKRFLDMVRGVELMTGATAEVTPYNTPYMARKPNAELNKSYLEGVSKLGMDYEIPVKGGRGSSDFGDVSQKVPGIHPYFAIADKEIACHSDAFRIASGSDMAFENAMTAAASMANTALRYLNDGDFKARVDADFNKETE